MEVSVSFLGDYNYPKIIDKLNNSDCDYIHYDVMDGKFVNNKNLSVTELKKLCSKSKKKIDIHLMVNDPSKYIDILSLFNVSCITIHKEIKNYKKYISKIKDYGFRVGLAINPETSVNLIKDDLEDVNLVLVMGVHPGLSGQEFIKSTTDKINDLIALRNKEKFNFKIEVDGGVNGNTLQYVKGADIAVSASFVLNDLNNINVIKNFKE